MKKAIAVLLTLCLVTLVIPPAPNGNHNHGVSTYEYSRQSHGN